MIPNFRIETKNGDLTDQIRSRLEKLTIRDEASWKSDSMTLELVDDGIEWPAAGLEFTVALGYDNVLTTVGKFTTKHIGVSMNGRRTLKIEAAAMESSAALKSQREQSWDGTTLGAIAEEIARRNGLKPMVFDELKSVAIDHEDQTESDIAFLVRLGRRFDHTVKVSGRYLMITPKDKGGDPSGTNQAIRIENPIRFEYSGDQTQRYTGVRAFWYDHEAAEKRFVMYGNEGVVLELEYNKITEADARRAAEAKFREVVRRGKTLTLAVAGNVQLAAERRIDVRGLGVGIDGEWVIKSVEHIIDGSGFHSNAECSVEPDSESKLKFEES
ncbi:MAG TPA: contractile injection system protein, VgrG/Pvc8 family [Oligoflexus sp.]|uniref:phage late control D family protein n=1 Tax=Oligoflexus sp. TaxID=1971216 RepID=UPI002D7EA6DF|nr:contractile injection system protein, VgrG/Pvc8 family [Oligoflexus sp.]HET9241014.1 contractile injection system protein, VgrG/Pvc8 family [Oligoflexus sp.]